jgi:hypothetical protein
VRIVKLIAAIRAGFGLVMLLRPSIVLRIFGIARTPSVDILARGIGSRDVVSSVRLLSGDVSRSEGRRYLYGQSAADLLELAAFVEAWRSGRRHWSGVAVPVMSVASAVGQFRLARQI